MAVRSISVATPDARLGEGSLENSISSPNKINHERGGCASNNFDMIKPRPVRALVDDDPLTYDAPAELFS